MPASQITPRITKRSRARKKPAGKPDGKRRTITAKRPCKVASTGADVLLIAQFADALGETPARKTRRPRKSLSQALDDARDDAPRSGFGDLHLMPGVVIADADRVFAAADAGDIVLPPCVAVHRRHRRHALGVSAAAWSCALVVSGAIISAAAAGFLAGGPVKTPVTIDMASAAHFE